MLVLALFFGENHYSVSFSQQTCIYNIALYTWFVIISDHWGTKYTENQYSDGAISHTFGDQATPSKNYSIN